MNLVFTKVVNRLNTVPVPAVPASIYRTGMYTGIETSTFRTGLNTPAISGNIGQYRAYRPVQFFFFFLSFVIFEFLLGQNGNLFSLTY